MFKVKNSINGIVMVVYGVNKIDECSAQFLFYLDGEWYWEEAENYEPIS